MDCALFVAVVVALTGPVFALAALAKLGALSREIEEVK